VPESQQLVGRRAMPRHDPLHLEHGISRRAALIADGNRRSAYPLLPDRHSPRRR
jgi:hypothetical protein